MSWVFGLEVVTLVVPGFNDPTPSCARSRSSWPPFPRDTWHVTAFHQDYKMLGPENTRRRRWFAQPPLDARPVFITYTPAICPAGPRAWKHALPGCGAVVVERRGFRVLRNQITDAGACPIAERYCGVWRAPSRRSKEDAGAVPLRMTES